MDLRMDKEIAQQLAEKCREFSLWFNEITEITIKMGNCEEARSIRKTVAEMLFLMDDGFMNDWKKQYPDIFPDDLI